MRRDGDQPRILMGRRASRHSFMPNRWVFPGGRVDRSDFTAPAARELSAAALEALSAGCPPRRARALAMAAVRETFEETGLLLARPTPEGTRRLERSGFTAAGCLPDLGALDYFARAVTPPSRPKRFDTRFFMADATDLVTPEAGGGSGELEELAWFTLAKTAGLDLPTPTRWILAEVALRLDVPGRPVLYKRFVIRDPGA